MTRKGKTMKKRSKRSTTRRRNQYGGEEIVQQNVMKSKINSIAELAISTLELKGKLNLLTSKLKRIHDELPDKKKKLEKEILELENKYYSILNEILTEIHHNKNTYNFHETATHSLAYYAVAVNHKDALTSI